MKYEAFNYKEGELANESMLKDHADYSAYKEATIDALSKLKFRKAMIAEFKEGLMPEISLLLE